MLAGPDGDKGVTEVRLGPARPPRGGLHGTGWGQQGQESGTAGSALRLSCPEMFFSPQIILCCKSFRQADILWRVHIGTDNISHGNEPCGKGEIYDFGNC